MPAEKKIPARAVLAGGEKITVQFHPIEGLDGVVQKTPETVTVRLVPVDEFGEYVDRVGSLHLFAEFLCGKPEGWAATVVDDDLFKIDEIGRRLNAFRLGRLIARQKSALQVMAPLAETASDLINSLRKPSHEASVTGSP